MRIKTIRIMNFRSHKDTTIHLSDYTCLIGPNGCGKSSILNALNIVFRESRDTSLDTLRLSELDFYNKNTKDPVRISVTFDQLSKDAINDLSAYVRHNVLTITAKAEWDESSQSALVKQFGERLVIKDFIPYFEANKIGKSAADLKNIYKSISKTYTELPSVTVKGQMYDALREYEEKHKDKCTPIESEDQFYGFSKGEAKLSKYIQWVFVPAVKDASAEGDNNKNSALDILLSRTIDTQHVFGNTFEDIRTTALTEYKAKIDTQQGLLDDLSKRLSSRMKSWANPNTSLTARWREDYEKSVTVNPPRVSILASENQFEGDISRFGHGFQRSYLLALLQELVGVSEEHQPTLVLGIEEPELYQHPPQARHLADLLYRLSKSGSQIISCSHSPYFVKGDKYSDLRIVSIDPRESQTSVISIDYDKVNDSINKANGNNRLITENALAVKLQKSLQQDITEIFFSRYVVLVEGIEDKAWIESWLILTGEYEKFHSMGGHIIPANCKSHMIEPIAIMNDIGIDYYVVFDGDNDCIHTENRKKHERDNLCIQSLCGTPDESAFSEECVFNENYTRWTSNIQASIIKSMSDEQWKNANDTAKSKHQLHVPNTKKSPMYIGHLLTQLHSERIDVKPLKMLAKSLLKT